MIQLLKERRLLGQTVLKVDCRGCMANDHKIEAVGVIVGVKNHEDLWPNKNSFPNPDAKRRHAVCLIIKTREDVPDEYFYPCLEDGAFMEAPSKRAWMWLL